ncbi:MAG: type 1 glutamine amidotransferase [Deltaproteobacteria bacterium]|nr:type 1 glutamine amidotransferase [Deltaproteobacteria bacterium]MBW1846353.1 type 1 glutamine amidotransferase [Deltaproteobacteria bacterium]MBW2179263.1 type 1 glutamine amidotransferase [Deltaproteobacteria bacterium]
MPTKNLNLLIIDGYSKKSRDHLKLSGMTLAWELYANMLIQHLPSAKYDVLLPSDKETIMPSAKDLENYAGIIWTGCDLSINDLNNPSVVNQIALAKDAYETGINSFGSCWAIQIAVVAAGGEVKPNPKGREMGLARKIHLTDAALSHPMFEGKPPVFDAFISHDDMVTVLPPGSVLLAGNDYTHVQAMVITHKKGTFWATQYHPEYNLHEMAMLIVAREEKLINLGFFEKHEDLAEHVSKMETIFKDQTRKDLRWQLVIEDDVLDDDIRQREFINWLNNLVLPNLK